MLPKLTRRVVSLFAVFTVVALAIAPAVTADTNVAPTVFATVSNANPGEGQAVVASATFTDPESATETYTCSIYYGDNSPIAAGVVSGMTCTGPAHRYLATGNYAILVTVTDSGGASGAWLTGANYTNYPPILGPIGYFGATEIGRPSHVLDPFTDSGYSLDPGAETYACTVDYGDGSAVQAGTWVPVWNPPFGACVGPDHIYQVPGTYTITVVVTDSGGASSSATTSATITAAVGLTVTAPPVQNVTSQQAAQYNGMYPYALGSFTDPGGTGAGPWQWTVSWGDGTGSSGTANSQSSLMAPHFYLPGAHQGHLVVTNAAGKSGDAYFNVTVAGDVVVGLNDPSQTATEGIPTNINLYFYDPYPPVMSAPYAIHINFGDGTSQDISTSSTAIPIALTHTYAAADQVPPGAPGTLYTATATVTDSQGRAGSTALQIGVYNVAPVVTSSDVSIPQGFSGPITIASFSDASVGPWTVVVDGGPGFQFQEQVAAPGPIQIPYAASSGAREFTVSVWDRGGMYATVTSHVRIISLRPVITSVHFTPSPAAEGSPVAVVATFTSPGLTSTPPDTFACFVDYGDGTGQKMGTVAGNTCNGPGHVYSGLGPYAATVSVVDSLDRIGTATVSLTLPNDPPVVGPVSVPYAFEVGVPITASATFTDGGAGVTNETYTCTVDYGDGGGPQPGSIVGTTCTGPSHAYSQNGDYYITVRVTDSNGGVGANSIGVGLYNIGPTITNLAFSPGPTLQGTPVSLVATFTDPGYGTTPETYTCYVYYGDSTGAQQGTVVGNQCHGPAHLFPGLGPYTVEVYVDDSNGGSGWAETDITLLNIAPVITSYAGTLFGQSGVYQAAFVTFVDPGSAPGNPPETYACTIDYGDGTGPQPGVIAGNICTGPNHAYATKGNFTFVATVTDSNGGVGTYSLLIDIYNPWPSVGAVSAPDSVPQGTSVVASAPFVSTGLDPADTCTVDYGDGTGPMAAVVTGTTCQGPAHVYATPGTFQITVKVLSEIGSSASSSKSIVVTSLGPVVGPISTPSSIVEGTPFAASATFTPGAPLQTYTCTVDYGDGSGPLAGVVTGTTCKGPSHSYGSWGSMTIAVVVRSSSGYTGTATKVVSVADVPPTITKLTAPSTAKLGTAVTASVTFTDPGFAETHTASFDWGDGGQSLVPLAAGVKTASANHTYAKAGSYAAHVTISGSTVPTNFVVAVYDPARTLTASGSANSPKGACRLTTACGAAGTAGFSMSASYAKNATTPTVSLAYSVTGFSFAANSADWFVAAGGTATIQGKGTVNGKTGYTYKVVAVDGQPDALRLQVWDSGGTLVYDNGSVAPLKAGSITIK